MSSLRQLLYRVGQVVVGVLAATILLTIVLTWTGAISIIVPSGNSMEPGIAAGDLVIVRDRADYEIGDIVAYQSDELGTVLHRIIANELANGGFQFVLQGDNNDFVDAQRPTEDDIRGALLLHIPGGAKILGLVPLLLAAAGAAWWINANGGSTRSQSDLRSFDDRLDVRRVAGGTFAAAFAVVAVISAGSSTIEPFDRTVIHSSSIELVWFGDTEVSPVYPTGRIRTGDPAFLNAVDELTVQVRTIIDPQIDDLNGNFQILATAGDPSGWTRQLTLTPRSPVTTGFQTLEGDFAVVDLWRDLREVAALTSYDPGRYDVTLEVNGRLEGIVGGHEVAMTVDHSIDFFLDGVVFRPKPEQNPIASVGGTVTVEDARPNTIGLATLTLPVAWLRLFAPFALVLSLLVGWWPRRERTPEEVINRRFGNHVLEVQEQVLPISGPLVNVEKFEDVLRLAQIEGSPILHLADGARHEWATLAVGIWYRYMLPVSIAGAAVSAAAVADDDQLMNPPHATEVATPAGDAPHNV